MAGVQLFCTVPGPTKRAAIRQSLAGPIATSCPASILRQHPQLHTFSPTWMDIPTWPTRDEQPTHIRSLDACSGRAERSNCSWLPGGGIAAIRPLPDLAAADLPWIGPGLTDLQVNGYAGLDFNAPYLTTDRVARLTRALWQEGVTSYLPTVITNSDEAIVASLRAIATARAADPLLAATIAGIHLEGPFISPEDGPRGAHDRAWVCPPDWARFARWQGAAGGGIRLVTLSPEWPEAPSFIARCTASGVVVAIGHTAATPAQIDAAVAAGARLSTHFGNGAHPLLPRHPNYLWSQLAHDTLAATLIGDPWHLPDAVLRVVMRVKGERGDPGQRHGGAGRPSRGRTPHQSATGSP